jgi:hypothetical protein
MSLPDRESRSARRNRAPNGQKGKRALCFVAIRKPPINSASSTMRWVTTGVHSAPWISDRRIDLLRTAGQIGELQACFRYGDTEASTSATSATRDSGSREAATRAP